MWLRSSGLAVLGILIRLKLDGGDADACPDGRLAAVGSGALMCPSHWSPMTIAWSVGSLVGSITDGLHVQRDISAPARPSQSWGWEH